MATPPEGPASRGRARDLSREIREFVRSHPEGWHHGDWVQFLARLREQGYDVTEPDAIGAELERARLGQALEGLGVSGLGRRRRDAIVERFGTLWELKHASAEEIASVGGIKPEMAEKIRGALN